MPTFPKTIGTTADRIYRLQQERLALSKQVDALKAQQRELEQHFIKLCRAQKTDTGRGKLATLSVQRVAVARVEDWPALYAHIVKRKAFDLLERRVAKVAWRDRLENKETVPGVRSEYVDNVSINKRSA